MVRLVYDPLNPPCRVCGDREAPTTGVFYASPEEIRFFCRDCLPDEYNERKLRAKGRKR